VKPEGHHQQHPENMLGAGRGKGFDKGMNVSTPSPYCAIKYFLSNWEFNFKRMGSASGMFSQGPFFRIT
jgi:hypothetical protein